MKSGDKLRLETLRFLVASVKNQAIDNRSKGKSEEATDQMVVEVLMREQKKRNDSIAVFKEAGRNDLVAAEEAQNKIVREFLPEMLSREDLEKIVDETLATLDNKDLGNVMKAITPKVKGRADGKLIAEIVKSKL